MKDLHDLVRGWIEKADSDLKTMRLLIQNNGPYDTACFHGQQAIEKLLKAYLAFRGQIFPRTHDLEELQNLILTLDLWPELDSLDLIEATGYAVLARYDLGFWPDKQTAVDTLALAEIARKVILARLPKESHP